MFGLNLVETIFISHAQPTKRLQSPMIPYYVPGVFHTSTQGKVLDNQHHLLNTYSMIQTLNMHSHTAHKSPGQGGRAPNSGLPEIRSTWLHSPCSSPGSTHIASSHTSTPTHCRTLNVQTTQLVQTACSQELRAVSSESMTWEVAHSATTKGTYETQTEVAKGPRTNSTPVTGGKTQERTIHR